VYARGHKILRLRQITKGGSSGIPQLRTRSPCLSGIGRFDFQPRRVHDHRSTNDRARLVANRVCRKIARSGRATGNINGSSLARRRRRSRSPSGERKQTERDSATGSNVGRLGFVLQRAVKLSRGAQARPAVFKAVPALVQQCGKYSRAFGSEDSFN